MNDNIRDIYEAEVNRFRDDAAGEDVESTLGEAHGDGVGILHLSQGRACWDNTYPRNVTPMEAYADGWAAYCDQDDQNPFETVDAELARQWEDGWADAEQAYGGGPCDG